MNTTPHGPAPAQRRSGLEILEGAILVLGLLSFWPFILGYRGLWVQCGILLVLAILVALAVVRFRRVKRAFEHEQETLRK